MAGETVITVVGNLTADPELRYTQNGIPVGRAHSSGTRHRQEVRTITRAASSGGGGTTDWDAVQPRAATSLTPADDSPSWATDDDTPF